MENQERSTRARSTLNQPQPTDTTSGQIGAASRARRLTSSAGSPARQLTESEPAQADSGVLGQVKQQAATRPWTALGISLVAGYALGSLGDSSATESADRSRATNSAPSFLNRPASPAAPEQASQPGVVDRVMDQFGSELNKLKQAALSTMLTFFRDTIKQNVPQLHQEIERVRQEHGLAGSLASSPTSQISTPSDRPMANQPVS